MATTLSLIVIFLPVAFMRWLTELGGNPRNKFVGFADGKHGTEIFGPHPELPRAIVSWLKDVLVTSVPSPDKPPTPVQTPAREFWTLVYRGDLTKATEYADAARARDPKVFLFPEADMNFAGYEQLQAGNAKAAVALFKMNVDAYPASANAQDSLGDGYVADGQPALALQAAQKCLTMDPHPPGGRSRRGPQSHSQSPRRPAIP